MAVLRAAYTNAGVPAQEVDYVEAHGTGTFSGVLIEARCLARFWVAAAARTHRC